MLKLVIAGLLAGRRVRVFVMGLVLFGTASIFPQNSYGAHRSVSIVNLLTTPSEFTGGSIDIKGYSVVDRDGMRVFLTRDDGRIGNVASSISIEDPSDDFLKSVRKSDNCFVMVLGKFGRSERGLAIIEVEAVYIIGMAEDGGRLDVIWLSAEAKAKWERWPNP